MKVKRKEKILVAMSGGVDSSVAAALLVKAGYDVTGAFMVNYDDGDNDLLPTSPLKRGGAESPPSPFKERVRERSCWRNDYQDALRVAARLKIPLLRFDFVKEYKKMVLDYTFKSYSAGRTPNPDILCNKFIKFGVWLEKAKKLGFDKLATGHYARVVCHCEEPKATKQSLAVVIPSGAEESLNVVCTLLQAKDTNKDQTYFLHQLSQKQLSQTLFPIGNYTKPQVRALAKKFDLPTANKAESMGICFVGEVPMREFLKGKVKAKNGKIISTTGEILGEHDGLPFYTIGERVGGLSLRAKRSNLSSLSFRAQPRNPLTPDTPPLFVIEKNTKNNTLTVGLADDTALFKKEIIVSGINWIAGQTPKLPLKCKVRLRHRQELQDCVVLLCHSERSEESLKVNNKTSVKGSFALRAQDDNKIVVKFTTPQRAVTPGQFAVFYRARRSLGEGRESFECLGGGAIL